MNIRIVSIRPSTADEWDTTWRECDYATYFHSREWAEIWQAYTDNNIRPDPKLIQFSDGIQVILPFSVQRLFRGLANCYLSSPAGTFGGWISKAPLKPVHAQLLVNFLAQKVGNLVWRINPYDPVAVITPVGHSDETHVLLLPENFEILQQQWKKGSGAIVRKAKKACREGVSIKIASSLQDWLAYYQVYEDSLRRWADKTSSPYNWLLFELIFQRSSPAIKLWLATYQEQVIAGALCFYAKKHVVYWHGAALESYFHLRPVNLLMWEAIKDACIQHSWFDFNPSGEHEGVKAFKKSFDAKALSCPLIQFNTKPTLFLQRIRSLIAE